MTFDASFGCCLERKKDGEIYKWILSAFAAVCTKSACCTVWRTMASRKRTSAKKKKKRARESSALSSFKHGTIANHCNLSVCLFPERAIVQGLACFSFAYVFINYDLNIHANNSLIKNSWCFFFLTFCCCWIKRNLWNAAPAAESDAHMMLGWLFINDLMYLPSGNNERS